MYTSSRSNKICIKFSLLLVPLICALFFVVTNTSQNSKAYAATSKPTINPTFGIIGPCPGCKPSTTVPTTSLPVKISPTIASPTSQATNRLQVDTPCGTPQGVNETTTNHIKSSGAMSNFIELLFRFLFELLNAFLRQIGGGQIPVPPPIPTPTPQTTPQPTVSPCPPTGQPSITPIQSTQPTPSPVSGSQGCGLQVTAGTMTKTLTIGGVQRSYLLVVPAGLDANKPVPVILGFHGGSGTSNEARQTYGLEGSGAVIYVYPQAPYWAEAGGVGWNVDPAGVDFPYFDTLLTDLGKSYCIDTKRVFATGKSNGGFFVNALACYRPHSLRAIASVAGGGPSGSCTKKDMAVMFVHGAADQTVPIGTGKYSLTYWLQNNKYQNAPTVPADPSPCISYSGTTQPVLWCEHGGGHDWPTWAGSGIRNFFLNL